MQVNTGIRSSLNLPKVYSLFQFIVGSASCQRQLLDTYLQIKPNDLVMDYGCGPGAFTEVLPATCGIVGFDVSQKYIDHANEKWGAPNRSYSTDLKAVEAKGPFDVSMAIGVLHHLSDLEAQDALTFMYENLKPGGRLITVDNIYIEKQNPIARWIISKDRGQNVRDLNGYSKLFEVTGKQPTHEIRHDLLRIPYTHVIFQITKT